MRKIILLIVLCYIQSCFAQDIDSLIEIRGYYVTVFSKQEITFSYEQKVKRDRGESYSTPIDFYTRSFFIPIQVRNEIVCEKDIIIEKFLNYIQNDSIYIIPSEQYSSLLKEMNIVTTDVSKETIILSESMRLSPYYEVRGINNSLFKITYIEGYAQYKSIQEIEKKWQNLLLHLLCSGKKPENAEFFFMTKITDYTPYIELLEIKKWLPYID